MSKWIDSCCIDKSSSAELSEAINSMYKWYANAQVCYAYLSDVVVDQKLRSALRLSQWFARGWTLQELLAPRVVEFYDRNWVEIGTKQSLSLLLTEITTIDHRLFSGSILDKASKQNICIAEKMSWAAKRKTTRAEDLAYSLMGLFDVNMPLLYGEGAQGAFIRLQTEIMAKSVDESIFAWSYPGNSINKRRHLPLLAEHPSWFINSTEFISVVLVERSSTHQMTSRGVRIEASRIPSKELDKKLRPLNELEGFLMPLNCVKTVLNEDVNPYYCHVLAVKMVKTDGSLGWKRLPNLEIIKVNGRTGESYFNERTIQSPPGRDTEIIHVSQTKPSGSFLETFPVRTLIRMHKLDEYDFNFIGDNTCYPLASVYYDNEYQKAIKYLGRNEQGDLILEYFGSKKDTDLEYGLLFGNESMEFVLIITLQISDVQEGYQCSCYLQSAVSSLEIEEHWKMGKLQVCCWDKPDIPFWTQLFRPHQNRCSHRLKDKLYVSASLRPGRESGSLVNIVDLTFGPHSRWVEGIRDAESCT
jgi:hypothetical protein